MRLTQTMTFKAKAVANKRYQIAVRLHFRPGFHRGLMANAVSCEGKDSLEGANSEVPIVLARHTAVIAALDGRRDRKMPAVGSAPYRARLILGRDVRRSSVHCRHVGPSDGNDQHGGPLDWHPRPIVLLFQTRAASIQRWFASTVASTPLVKL